MDLSNVAIVGSFETDLGVVTDRGPMALGVQATLGAIADAVNVAWPWKIFFGLFDSQALGLFVSIRKEKSV